MRANKLSSNRGVRCVRLVILAVVALLSVGEQAVTIAEAPTAIATDVEKIGLRVQGKQLVLMEEVEFVKELARCKELNATVRKGQSDLRLHEKNLKAGNEQIDRLRGEIARLNGQLAQVAGGNVALNNKIVGTLNVLSSQLQDLVEKRETFAGEGRKMRGEHNQARELFVQHVLDLRQKADALDAAYAAKVNDAEIATAVRDWAQASGKEAVFGPGPALKGNLKRLKSFEDAILSEDIPMEREGGVQLVSVMVNGDQVEPMIIDSGCGSMLIPHRFAERFGVPVTEGDQQVTCVLADGRTVKGTAKRLQSVRVGKFTVDDVECVVLGPDAPNAPLLLGMSFLGNFEFKINAEAGLLTMVKVDEGKQE